MECPKVSLVFCGSDKGNLDYIKQVIKEFGLEERARYLGFLSNSEVQVLYENALALVMPTFLGPTNMPLLEARSLDCPVLCSDLMGHRELMGNGALYFDPKDAKDICSAMDSISNSTTREKIVHAAKEEQQSSIFNKQSALEHLNQGFIEVKQIRNCWGHNPI